MASGFRQQTRRPSQSSSCSSNNGSNNDVGDFMCNICFELAQDPIVTLCGHLFCWPCLYKWLHIHSLSRECPVCKALIEEEKLVPLYGRGKNSMDPRSKSIPGVEIPNRPAGQRPETALPPDTNTNHFAPHGFGFMGGMRGFDPAVSSARLGYGALGGFIPSLFNIQPHGFSDAHHAPAYGAGAGYPHGYSHHTFYRGYAHGFRQQARQQRQDDFSLKLLFLIIFVFTFITLSFM